MILIVLIFIVLNIMHLCFIDDVRFILLIAFSERLIMKLNESTIKAIEAALTNKKSLEIRIEKNKVVLIELNRKVIDKSPYTD